MSGLKGGVVVKGLAKLANRLRHVLRDKCVDASLFGKPKRGYSPMTGAIIAARVALDDAMMSSGNIAPLRPLRRPRTVPTIPP